MSTKSTSLSTATYAIYTRISRDRDGQQAGVKRQREDCEKLAAARGVKVVIYTDDDRSAYSGKPRPEYLRMLGDLKAGVISGVICWHPDRLHRSPRELEDFIDLVELTQAEVLTVQAGDYDLGTASGRMTARIVGAVARGESEHKADRLKRKHRQIAEEGGWSGGGRPFGYDLDPDTKGPDTKGLVIIEEEAALIRDAAKAVIAGASVRSIALGWNDAAVKTPRGNGWVPPVVRRVLLGSTIRGERAHRGVRTKANWDAILDHPTAVTLEATLTNPARSPIPITARKQPLAGFLVCALCGSRMVSAHSNHAPAFACRRGATPESCGKIIISLKPLQELIGKWVVERLLLSPKTLATAATRHESGSEEATTAAELAALDARSDELNAEYLDGNITAARLGQLAGALEKKRETLMSRLAAVSASSVRSSLPTDRAALEHIWNHGDLDRKRAMLSLVFSGIEIGPAAHKGARFNQDRVTPHWRGASAT